ncbi:MAG: hypothetical protein OWU32_01710 [Firmicutes bacterium]|nr:hypothetical protein [Bacillota bacterium]
MAIRQSAGHLLTAVALVLASGLVGCSAVADSGDLKNARTLNNATLNSSDVVATAFRSRDDLSRKIMRAMPQVEAAEVLTRYGTAFVGLSLRTDAMGITKEAPHALLAKPDNHPRMAPVAMAQPVPAKVRQVVLNTLHSAAPELQSVYVTRDQTLTTHFHLFASDRATGRPTGSDLVLDDIARVFPSYSRG